MNRSNLNIPEISVKPASGLWVGGTRYSTPLVPTQLPTPGTPPLDHARGVHDVSAAVQCVRQSKYGCGALIRRPTHLEPGLVGQ